MTEEETFRLVVVGDHDNPTPKEIGEATRRVHLHGAPFIEELMRTSMQGHITYDETNYQALWNYVLGTMATEVTYGRCLNCGDAPSKHRGPEGLIPCTNCGCLKWKSSNPPEVRERYQKAFIGVTKFRDAGELDDVVLKAILFSLLDLNQEASAKLKAFLNIRRRPVTPEEAEVMDGPQHQALPG